jgi:aldose 1-epimerase
MELREEYFGTTKDGEKVFKYIFENNFKTKIEILNYGCIVQSIEAPDKLGQFSDIVLGYDSLEEYEDDTHYLGAVVGRVANRIGKAQYIDGPFMVKLDANEGKHHLHGGYKGLNKVVWKARTFKKNNSLGVELTYRSVDGDSGYPGNVDFKTSYILNNKNQFMIYFNAETDKRTPINLTSHIYYNLSGGKSPLVLDHIAMINALKYLDTDADKIPTGKFNFLMGSPVNFSRGKNIGADIDKMENGYDHAFIINKEIGRFLVTSRVIEPDSGRILDIVTDQPTIQFYTSNHFDGSQKGKKGSKLVKHGAFCMEAQGFPDAPNHSDFPTIFLNPGEKYSSHTQISFQIKYD